MAPVETALQRGVLWSRSSCEAVSLGLLGLPPPLAQVSLRILDEGARQRHVMGPYTFRKETHLCTTESVL
ncbi:hypothetical protein NDU88_006072 [Pleurodeles waltl]|uniref:Uncharacterized protein n=1 Tax=Pleurodeles waltl TaxID=8319 RepID=A0AAV7WWI9_PLEWA|nr:hypothetical protein NDU88_006072 [Pleurodeles waltl]